MHSVCLVELLAIVNYIQILSGVSNVLVANYFTDNNAQYRVSEINYILTNFHSCRTV